MRPGDRPGPPKRSLGGLLARIILTVVFLAVALAQVDLDKLAELVPFSWWALAYMIAAFAALFLAAVINTWKWWLLLDGVGVRVLPRRVLYHYLVGYFLNNILTGVGEIKRTVDVARESRRPGPVVLTVFLERWTGVTAQAGVSLLAVTAAAFLHPAPLLTWLAVFNLLAFVALILALGMARRFLGSQGAGSPSPVSARRGRRGWRGWLAGMGEAMGKVQHEPSIMVRSLLASVVVSLLGIVAHLLVGLGLGIGVRASGFALMVPIAWVFGQLPVSLNGLGVQEVAYMGLFGATGLTQEKALALSIAAHILKLSVGAVGGILLLFGGWPLVSMEGKRFRAQKKALNFSQEVRP